MIIKRLLGSISIVALLAVPPAAADVGNKMTNFWTDMGGRMNVTEPGKGQQAGYYTGGGVFMRTPVRQANLAAITLPSFRAGCGGIDAFAGAFSHISAGEFVSTLKGIANNAAGFAFQIGIETLAPVVAEKLGELNDLMQRINQASINSCETAQAAVGSLWPQMQRSSKAICEQIGNNQGLFSDYAAARHGCGKRGQLASTLATATGPEAEQIPINKNLTWEALKAHPLIADDPEFMRLLLTIMGTMMVVTPDNDSQPGKLDILPPQVINPETISVLLNGGSVRVHRCADAGNKCLDLRRYDETITITAGKGFKERVSGLLTNIISNIKNRQANSAAEGDLLKVTTLPVQKMLAVQATYQPMAAAIQANQYADIIALDILYEFLGMTIDMVEESATAKIQIADQTLLRDWLDTLSKSRLALARHRSQSYDTMNRSMELIERTQFVEGQLMSRLGPRLAANINFSRR
ncbi:conjugal transfer protein TraH [Asticcacaulis sp.]|uniref:conjugal transfer protein TraH n=1 Tax=Asticcacaulis sp. TaxID=1872648 RepID=UPI002633EE1F|nr:conjugal transfer protein TraH [Asticcacaulis sp.]